MARFMARRNITRFFKLLRNAVSDDLRIRLRLAHFFNVDMHRHRHQARSSLRSTSISSPFLPMTTPGRPLKIVMRAFLAGRSITTLETDAWASFFFR